MSRRLTRVPYSKARELAAYAALYALEHDIRMHDQKRDGSYSRASRPPTTAESVEHARSNGVHVLPGRTRP